MAAEMAMNAIVAGEMLPMRPVPICSSRGRICGLASQKRVPYIKNATHLAHENSMVYGSDVFRRPVPFTVVYYINWIVCVICMKTRLTSEKPPELARKVE